MLAVQIKHSLKDIPSIYGAVGDVSWRCTDIMHMVSFDRSWILVCDPYQGAPGWRSLKTLGGNYVVIKFVDLVILWLYTHLLVRWSTLTNFGCYLKYNYVHFLCIRFKCGLFISYQVRNWNLNKMWPDAYREKNEAQKPWAQKHWS
jgi:hypothetical protein